jgi:hypothetical protein
MRRVLSLAVTFALLSCASLPSRARDETLSTYWPVHGSQRSWDLIGTEQKDSPSPKTLMTVRNKSLDENVFELWFSNKEGQVEGQADIERYQLCANPGGNPWLFLTEYIDAKPGHPTVEHPVTTTRVLFTPKDGKTFDLIANGTYARCGGKGQPYLLWNMGLDQYHIQVWGYLTENPKFKWFWDATVSKPSPISNDCLKGAHAVKAIRVEEAWWSTFGVPTGKWGLGSGEADAEGVPTGKAVKHGRSVWHAEGGYPYYLTGSPDGKHVGWCMKKVDAKADAK